MSLLLILRVNIFYHAYDDRITPTSCCYSVSIRLPK